jgi:alginate O-acetyltransferase complex protein AlgF
MIYKRTELCYRSSLLTQSGITIMKRLLQSLAVLLTGISSHAAQAVDVELYDPAPPANSAFVRVINGDTTGASATPRLGDTNYGALAAPAVSGYRAIPAGEQAFSAGGIKMSYTVEAGKYYSILLKSVHAALFKEDALLANPAKARIYFYNLSDAVGSVVAPAQKADVLKDIASNKGESREINALTLDLEVKAAGASVQVFPKVVLKRREGTSLLLTGQKGAYHAIVVQNVVAR